MVLKGYYLGDYLFDSRYRNVTKDVQAEMLETVNNNENDNDNYELVRKAKRTNDLA
jgi:hypothetical protein